MKVAEVLGRYRAERARKQSQQREELREHMEPWLADLGDEILAARSKGMSIEGIGNMMDLHNRTFIYDAIRAAKARGKVNGNTPTQEAPIPENATEDDKPYAIHYFDGVVQVVFPQGETYEIVLVDGEPDVPEEWADHTKERRKLYKEILSEIREHD